MARWGLFFAIVIAACTGDSGSASIDARGGGGGGPDAPGGGGGGGGEPMNLTGILAAHNNVRAMVQTSPALPPLTWNNDLAATAAAWVAMCQDTDHNGLVDHNANRSVGHPTYVGENIFAASGTATGPAAVQLWASEGANYNYANNTCSGGTCGHYTQLVWRATTEVGCALGNCPGLTYPNAIVCDYMPGGNSGGKPY